MWKHSNPRKERLRRGVRGAISLFMVIIMMPFLSIAGILVEAGKYNSAVSITDEAMGVSATSTLANYDDYLRKRWGLSAVSQTIDINGTFADSLAYNGNVLGKNVTFNKVSAKGLSDYALSNNDLLKSQIYEFSKLNAPTKLASEFLDLSELVSSLQDIANISKIADMAKSMFNISSKVVKFGQNVGKLVNSAKDVDKAESSYKNGFKSFKTAVNEYIDALVEVDECKRDVSKIDAELGSLGSDLDELNGKVGAEQQKTDELQNRLKELEENEGTDHESDEYRMEHEELEKELKEQKKAQKQVQKRYDSKEEQLSAKNTELKKARSALSSAEDAASTAKHSAGEQRANYVNAISSVIVAIENYRDQFSSTNDSLKNIRNSFNDTIAAGVNLYTSLSDSELDNKISDIEDEQKKLKNEGKTAGTEYLALGREKTKLLDQQATNKTVKSVNKAAEAGINSMEQDWGKTTSGCSTRTLDTVRNKFNTVRTNVSEYDIDSLSSSSTKIKTNAMGLNSRYFPCKNVSAYVKAASLNDYLEQKAKDLSTSFGKFLNGMATFANRMLKTKLFFDGNLSACINTARYGDELVGNWTGDAEEGTPLAIFNDVGAIIAKSQEAATKFFSARFVSSWKAIKALAKECLNFANDCVKFAATVGSNVARLFDYKKHYLTTYAAWNLPCRTDALGKVGGKLSEVVDFSTMSGFNVKDSHLPTRDYRAVDSFGDLSAIVETLQAVMNETGGDYTFCGCELEYVLFGSNSEIANQLYTFCALYLIRLLPSTISVILNDEVAEMAEAVGAATLGVGALVVYVIIILAEPLVDTIILVNGGEVAIYETKVHLTPSGIAGLLTEFVKIGLSEAEKEDLKNDFKEAYGGKIEVKESYKSTSFRDPKLKKTFKSWAEDLLKFDYRQYCYVAVFLTLSDAQILNRIRNLIQMETENYYRTEGMGSFSIKKAYTYISTEADISVKQLLPSLTDSNLFRIQRKQYRGY